MPESASYPDRNPAQRKFRPATRTQGEIVRIAVVVATFGAVAGALWLWAFAEQRRDLTDLPFLVWGIFVVGLGLTSGLVFIYGMASWAAISALQPIDWRPLQIRTGVAAAVASALVGLNFVIDPSMGTVRGFGLTVVAIIGGFPAFAGMLGIRAAVAARRSTESRTSDRLQVYLELRILASQLLSALGSLVALTTFTLGASMLAYRAWQGLVTVQVLLVYGGFGTVLVAVGYQISRSALRQEARLLTAELAPLAAEDPPTLRQELEERDMVERTLGLQTDLLNELQTGIIILSPLLAAASALLIRGG
jgi:hypothetical protein